MRRGIAAFALLGIGWPGCLPADASVAYVGSGACSHCHQREVSSWQGSHHDLAMQVANEESVLGNFNNTSFVYGDVTSMFFRKDGRYYVRTDNAQGELEAFAIRYTFGVEPLQQYLIEQGDGKIQALGIAWDSRPEEAGGQRWFHLYADQAVDFQHTLHWTGRRQNWNYQCAECHSTHIEKNYDAGSDAYATTWSEIDVSCEACHGPGADHLVWAAGAHKDEGNRKGLTHTFTVGTSFYPDPKSGIPVVHGVRDDTEIGTCAACHSRRAQLFEDDRQGQPLMQGFLPSLLQQGLYHADGQIEDEVYVYGSFLQSRMYEAGVTCSNCHDPHSARLKVAGNGVCLQCHGAEPYDTKNHHFHKPDSTGSACVSCHMPQKNYMVVDPRRDHSFRIPDPALSVALGTPNACNQCHSQHPAEWARQHVNEWYGPIESRFEKPAKVMARSWAGSSDASTSLMALLGESSQGKIVTATLTRELGNYLDPQTVSTIAGFLFDSDALVRAAAVQSLERLPIALRVQLFSRLLDDDSRVVRTLVGYALADVQLNQVEPVVAKKLSAAWDLYLQSQQFNADDAGALTNLGNFYVKQRSMVSAESYFREAIERDRTWVPAYINLSDMLRIEGRDPEGFAVLQSGILSQPDAADLHHALGLWYVRQKDMEAALASLKRAAQMTPENVRYTYVYAVALNSEGFNREALETIDRMLAHAPQQRSLLELRAQLEQDAPSEKGLPPAAP